MFSYFKKLSIWGLLFFIFMTFVPNLPAQDFFPIISWSCPSDGGLRNHHVYFPQVQADGFNTIYQTHFDNTEFITAASPDLELRLISMLYYRFCEGQQSFYESDEHAINGEANTEHFSHNNIVGEEVFDPGIAFYDWAWRARTTAYSEGYMQRGLLPQFNKEQNVLRPNDDLFNPHTFFADFFMRIPALTSMPSRRIDIVRLEVVLNNENVTDLVLATREITSGEFQDSSAVGDAYCPFRLTFQETGAQEEAMTAGSHGLDYRVYWYNETDVYLDRVRLRDCFFDTLITGGYDAEITTEINNFNTYFLNNTNTLFRWYLRDEPHLDMYPANQYITNFLRAFPGGTAEGIQATSGDISRLDNFMATIQPNELFYNGYQFYGNVDTNSTTPYSAPHFTATLQDSLDALLDHYEYARSRADNGGVEFWPVVQAHVFIRNDAVNLRYPTNRELICQVNLALAYGARGLCYFIYRSDDGFDPANIPPPAPAPEPVDHHIFSEDPFVEQERGREMQAGWCGSGGLYWENPTPPPATWEPVETYNTTHDTLVNAVRFINNIVDSLASVLLHLDWQNSYDWQHLPGGFYIGEITGTLEPEFIQIGTFLHETTNDDFFMLINKRCCVAETQTVTLNMNLPAGQWQLEDQYSHEKWITSAGIFRDIPFTPGQGRLFHLRPFFDTTGETWEHPVYISSDITVSDGDTLFIQPGAEVTFLSRIDDSAGGRISNLAELRIEGRLQAEGGIFQSTNGNQRDWHGIIFYYAAYNSYIQNATLQHTLAGILCMNSTVTVEGCTIELASNHGLWWHYSGGVLQENLVRNNNRYGIYCAHSQPYIYNNKFEDNYSYCVYFNHQSHPYFRHNDVINNSAGIICSNNSNPNLIGLGGGDYQFGANEISNNGSYAVKVYSGSNPNLGAVSDINSVFSGSNTISNYTYAIYNATGSTIQARTNYWGTPNPFWPEIFYGPVSYSPHRTTPYPQAGALWKTNAQDKEIEKYLIQAYQAEGKENYDKAIENYRYVVNLFPESEYAVHAFARLMACRTKASQIETEKSYIVQLTESSRSSELKVMSNFWLLAIYGTEKDQAAAEKLYEQLKSSQKDDKSFIRDLKFEMAMVYYYDFQEYENSKKLLAEIVSGFPEDPVVDLIKSLDFLFEEPSGFGKPLESSTNQQMLSNINPIANFPNPFNNLTQIKYLVSEASPVTLRIFNMQGRKVITLVNSQQEPGIYQVQWEGKNNYGISVASGIYFYQLQTGKKQITKKMIFLK